MDGRLGNTDTHETDLCTRPFDRGTHSNQPGTHQASRIFNGLGESPLEASSDQTTVAIIVDTRVIEAFGGAKVCHGARVQGRLGG